MSAPVALSESRDRTRGRLDGARVASEDRRQVLVHRGLYLHRVIVAVAIDHRDRVPLQQEARDRLIDAQVGGRAVRERHGRFGLGVVAGAGGASDDRAHEAPRTEEKLPDFTINTHASPSSPGRAPRLARFDNQRAPLRVTKQPSL